MREAEFQRQVTDLADATGWLWWHDTDSRKNRKGFLDLVLVRWDVLAFLELKIHPEGTKKGTPTPEQEQWIAALKRVKIVVADVVRPEDWDQVEAVLTAKAR